MCRALLRRGIAVPGRVSVVGFDNLIAPFAFPTLTSVDHRLHDMGHRACQLAMDMAIDKDAQPRISQTTEVIAPQLVVRESSGVVSRGLKGLNDTDAI